MVNAVCNLRLFRAYGLVLALLVAMPALAESGRLGLISGEVSIGRGEPPVWSPPRSGDALAAGDQIRTGREGRVELVWQGATIRLFGDSLLRLPEERRGVALDQGDGLFDVLKRVGKSFEVETPDVVVSVKGTRFAVELEGETASVAVYRGSVGVRTSETLQHEVIVREGFRALGASDGPAELFLLRESDPWTTWGPGAVPPRSARAAALDAPARVAAVREAKQVARRMYQREALDQAAKQDPEVAKGVARMERAEAEKRRELGDGRKGGGEEPWGTSQRPLPAKLDPLVDANLDALDEALRDQFIDRWVNGPTAGSGAFSIAPGVGDGVNLSENATGQSWFFNHSELQSMIAGGQSIPPTLATALSDAGVTNTLAFIQMLLVIGNN